MKISFCQTYGDRLWLIKAREKDTLFLKLLDNFDINILSLHNVNDSILNYIQQSEVYKKFYIIVQKGITYQQCIQNLLFFLEEKNTQKFLFYQDDTFSNELNEQNYNDFIDSILNYNFPLYNISYKLDYLKYQDKSTWTEEHRKKVLQKETFCIYDTDTYDFAKSGLYGMDDSAYVCNLQTVQSIYDKIYINNFSDIWRAEAYLTHKYSNYVQQPRYISDISFVKNYNIFGPCGRQENKHELLNKLNCSEADLQ